jgi:hypothetical protein
MRAELQSCKLYMCVETILGGVREKNYVFSCDLRLGYVHRKGATTFSITTFSMTTFSIMDLFVTLSIMTFGKAYSLNMLSVGILNVIFSYCYPECHHAECRYSECHYAECRGVQGRVITVSTSKLNTHIEAREY